MSELTIETQPEVIRSEASTDCEVMAFHVDRGTRIRVSRWGDGSPIFLLIHGFGDGWFVWEGMH